MNLFESLIRQIQFKDGVDIFIVATLIYQVLLIIRGTRAVQMLIGVFALFLLFWIGQRYELYSLNWVLSNIFDSLLIIVIIVFQEQIRTAFANIGSGGRFFEGIRQATVEKEIHELIDVIAVLQKKNVGALIVIERNNGLENYSDSGSRLDAEMHSDLLYSIFQTHSPLHDGAVIISKGRIRAAGCFLPLSKRMDIDRGFGTRHRAALGVSENTDAIAITVSEETGKIHLCHSGKFEFFKDATQMGSALKLLMRKEKGMKSKGFMEARKDV
jgi:diadenylate cyclase